MRHMDTVERCTLLLEPFVDAVLARDFERAAAVQHEIAQLEDEADDQKHELRMHLPSTLFLPVDRRDLLDVLTMQDNIANRAKDIAGLMVGRGISNSGGVSERPLKYRDSGLSGRSPLADK